MQTVCICCTIIISELSRHLDRQQDDFQKRNLSNGCLPCITEKGYGNREETVKEHLQAHNLSFLYQCTASLNFMGTRAQWLCRSWEWPSSGQALVMPNLGSSGNGDARLGNPGAGHGSISARHGSIDAGHGSISAKLSRGSKEFLLLDYFLERRKHPL